VTVWQWYVREFHLAMGCRIGLGDPQLADKDTRDLRVELLVEECAETVDALNRGDLPGIADGLVDLIYVAIGTAVSMGIDLEPVFHEVHMANMRKADGPISATGKKLKPPGWVPPDIEGQLRKQGWRP
jgi:predicted HAD superfamily Cof-like phosphohydrolase